MKNLELNKLFLTLALLVMSAISGCSNDGPPRVIASNPGDVINPEAFLLGSVSLTKNAVGIFASDYVAYVVTSDETEGTLVLFDITDLEFPFYVNGINLAFRSFNIGQRGTFGPAGTPSAESGFIYIPVGANGLQIADVTDASNITLFPTYAPTGGAVLDIALSADFACVAYTNSLLTISSTATGGLPTNILSISTDTDDTYCYLIETSNNNNTALFRVIDPSNVSLPVEVGSMALDGKEVIVMDTYAYVLVEDNGLSIIDISNPAAPALVSQTEAFPTVKGDDTFGILSIFTIDKINKRAYVSMPNGIKIFDITDPLFPVDIGGFELFDTPSAINVNNGILYIATVDLTGFNPPQLLVINVSQF